MFAYCNNNPVVGFDPSGKFVGTLIGGFVGAVCGAAVAIFEGETDPQVIMAKAANGAISGAVAGLAADVILVTGGSGAAVVLAYAGAGLVGGALGELAEQEIMDDNRPVGSRLIDIGLSGASGAAWGGVFGAVSGPVKSIMGNATTKMGESAMEYTSRAISTIADNIVKKPMSIVTGVVEEFTANFISWIGDLGVNYFKNNIIQNFAS